MKPLTQVQRMQAYMGANMYQVMELLNWPKMTYCETQFYCGIAYINRVLPHEHDRQAVIMSAGFWGWWKMQWYLREKEWLRSGYMGIYHNGTLVMGCAFLPYRQSSFDGVFQRRTFYFQTLHNPHVLADILEDSYSRDLVKELR